MMKSSNAVSVSRVTPFSNSILRSGNHHTEWVADATSTRPEGAAHLRVDIRFTPSDIGTIEHHHSRYTIGKTLLSQRLKLAIFLRPYRDNVVAAPFETEVELAGQLIEHPISLDVHLSFQTSRYWIIASVYNGGVR